MRNRTRKILIADDEPALLDLVQELLCQAGFKTIFTAKNVKEAIVRFAQEKPEAAILDVMLPDGDGFEILEFIRQSSIIPILFLTAHDEDENRLKGWGMGADDYITKPFHPQELILRVEAVLRRAYPADNTHEENNGRLQLGKKILDMNSSTVIDMAGENISLTAKEFVLLQKLIENQGKIVTTDSLCRAAWEGELWGYENTLMVHIRRIREKIEADPSKPKYLLTVRGLGYKLIMEKNNE